MKIAGKEPELEITAVSGTLRVSIRPRATLRSLGFRAILIAVFVYFLAADWKHATVLTRLVEVAVVLGGVIEWFKHLSGSVETIEFGPSVLKITKEVLGWERTSEYPVDTCSELKL